jgi:hypothetical protein
VELSQSSLKLDWFSFTTKMTLFEYLFFCKSIQSMLSMQIIQSMQTYIQSMQRMQTYIQSMQRMQTYIQSMQTYIQSM